MIVFSLLMINNQSIIGQTTDIDGDWTKNYMFLKNTKEAEFMIRVGDIDNLNCGWKEDFNPFCGLPTEAHLYPMPGNPQDIPGMDRIILGSSYKGNRTGDGYSESFSEKTKGVPIKISLTGLKGSQVKSVKMQIFIDDFQSPSVGSAFIATINGKRFIELEQLLRVVDQSGPIGKLITLDIPSELLPEFLKESIDFFIDDPTTGAGDGYALDFIKILVNPSQIKVYKGNLSVKVLDSEGNPVADVAISLSNEITAKTNAEGSFEFKDLLPGLVTIHAYKKEFANVYKSVDVECDKTTEVELTLKKSGKAEFKGITVMEGDAVTLSQIQFNAGNAVLTANAKTELDLIYNFLNSNASVEIEFSGFTSSEGDAIVNKNLSLQRVDACKQYLVNKGIDQNRIFTIGCGPDKPIAPNDTEVNRAKNRRVEMRITKI
jgi:OmpA-OmpF porin, OOP family